MSLPGPVSLRIDSNGCRLAAMAWGDPDARPVLGLHGWQDNAASLSRLAPLLRDIYLVSIDLPGHGHSEARGNGANYHFADYAIDAFAAAASLRWERFAILGHSLGGAVGMLMAGADPERVERLIIIDGVGPYSTEPAESPALLRRAVRSRVENEGRPRRVYATLDEAAERVAAAHAGMTPAAARALAARGTEGVAGGLRFSRDPRLQHPSPLRLSEAHVHAFATAITCPTLAIIASNGPFAGVPLIEERVRRIKPVRIEEVPGGHHVHLDDPEGVAPLVQGFLDETG